MENFLAFLGRFWELLARRVDSFLMAAALAIVGVGLVTLFSASDQSIARVTSQALSLGFALVLMWIVANVAPQQLSRAALPLYAVSVLLLVAVALGGTMVNGTESSPCCCHFPASLGPDTVMLPARPSNRRSHQASSARGRPVGNGAVTISRPDAPLGAALRFAGLIVTVPCTGESRATTEKFATHKLPLI